MRTQGKTPSQSASTNEETGLFRKRPFAEFGQTESDEEQPQELPDLQTQMERSARFNQSLSRLKVHGDRPAVQPKFAFGQPRFHHQQPTNFVARQPLSMAGLATNQPIQRQEENEEEAPVQTQLETNAVQTFSEPTEEEQEETPLQAKAELADLQQPEQEEQTPLQAKLETTSVQRLSESAQEEQEELPLQAQAESAQRQQPEAEQEEPPQGIHLKVVVGQAGDGYEQEADRVAQQVMAMPEPTANSQPVQRQVEEEQEEESVQKSALADSITPLIQRASEEEPLQHSANGGSQASGDLETRLKSSKGGGSPLPNEVRSFMEPRFGVDFSSVRVHTDSSAVQMNKDLGAQAFTQGNDIYYGAGKSPAQDDLTAHELTHVVQQTGGIQPKLNNTQSSNNSSQKTVSTETSSHKSGTKTSEIIPISEESQDVCVQRLCAECKEELKERRLAHEDSEENQIQAKEMPGSGSALDSDPALYNTQPSPQSTASTTPVVNGTQTSEPELPQNQLPHTRAPSTSDAGKPVSAGTETATGETATSTERPPNNPQAETEAAKNVQQSAQQATKSSKPEFTQSVEIVTQQQAASATATPGAPPSQTESQGTHNESTATPATVPNVGQLPSGAEKVPSVGDKSKGEVPSNKTAGAASNGKGETPGNSNAQGEKGSEAGAGSKGALKNSPEAQTVKQALSKHQVAAQDSQAGAGAVTTQVIAEKEAAITKAGDANAQLEATRAQAQQLASAGVDFALPTQEESADEGEVPTIARKAEPSANPSAFLEQQRVSASAVASQFLAQAAGRAESISFIGQTVSPRILAVAETAKASVSAAVEQQRATVTAQITQARAQAQAEAQAAIAQISAQHAPALAAIRAATTTARTQVETAYTTAMSTVAEREGQQVGRVNQLYGDADQAYRGAGTKVGNEAMAAAQQRHNDYASHVRNPKQDDSFLDGPLTDNQWEARANAALDVGKQYQNSLVEEANKQATQAQNSKPTDLDAVRQTATQSRTELGTQRQAALDSLSAAQEQALQQANDARTHLIETVNQTLQSTLQSLQQRESTQLQLLTDCGQQRTAAIDQNAHSAIANLLTSTHEATSGLNGVLQKFQAQMQGKAAPNTTVLSAMLANAFGQIDGAISNVEGQINQGIATAEQGMAQGAQQMVVSVTSIGQEAVSAIGEISQGSNTALTQLGQNATQTFNQISDAHTTQVNGTATTTVTGFQQITQRIDTAFAQMNERFEAGYKQRVANLEQALRGALPALQNDIRDYADEAASHVEPRWKTVVKWVLIIAIVVVVAVVVGPLVVGAVGGFLGSTLAGAVIGGAIVGAGTSAAIQVVNNWASNRNLSEGVGQAAIVGAIGGALGGFAGAGIQGLASKYALGAVSKFALQAGADLAINTGTELATTGHVSWESVAMSLAFSAGLHGLSSIKGVSNFQERMTASGEAFGANMAGRPAPSTPVSAGTSTRSTATDAEVPSHSATPEVEAPNRPATAEAEAPSHPATAEVEAPSRPATGDAEATGPASGTNAEVEPTKGSKAQVDEPPKSEVVAEETTPTKHPVSEESTPNGRSTHADEPEIEPGVVAKEQAADGHEIKVLKDGRVVRCSDCGEIRNKYAEELEQNPDFKKRLDEIEKIPDSNTKVKQARDLEIELAQTRLKNRDQLSLGRQENETDQGYIKRLEDLTDTSPRQKPDGKIETEEEAFDRALAAETKLKEDPLVQDIKTRIEGSQENLDSAARRQAQYDQAAQDLWTTKTGKPDPVDLGGGKKVDPLDPSTSKQDLEDALRVLESRQTQDSQTQQRIKDLRTRLDKSNHSEHISNAQKEFLTGDQSDEAIVKRILNGEEHVWCGSEEQAQRVSNLLEELALPDGQKAGDFHGPEKHTGGAGGPKEIHFNVKLEYNGKPKSSHIFYPEE